jgi:hypothetical protein
LHLRERQQDKRIVSESVLPRQGATDMLAFRSRHQHGGVSGRTLSIAGNSGNRIKAGGPTLANLAKRIEKAICVPRQCRLDPIARE